MKPGSITAILDDGLDELATSAHAGFWPRAAVNAATAGVFTMVLPWATCLTWGCLTLALEGLGWFATRRQFLGQAVGWRTRLFQVTCLALSALAWVSLVALAWTTGASVWARYAVTVWLALVFAGDGVMRMLEARRRFEAAQAEVRRSEALYRLLADNVTDVITLANANGKRIYMSPSIERALGYPLAELYAMPIYAYVHPDDREALQGAMGELAASGRTTAEYRVVRADGSPLWVETSFNVVGRDQGVDPPQVVSVARAIERRKELEAELIAARLAAEAAAAAKSDFLANMTHELRTPLNAIIGFAGLLKASPRLSGLDARHARLIGDASATLLALVNDVLDFSRLEAGATDLNPAPFDPRVEAEAVVELISGQAAVKGLTLTLEADGEGRLLGDAARLRQVLLNLVSNAVKFTVRGGVTVRLAWPAGGDGAVRLRAEVADTGVGIAPAHAASVFERFTQADVSVSRRFGGAGLGLAICKRIVELMGGEIGLTSVEGGGSTFWFEVPLAPAEAFAIDAEPAGAPALERPVRLLLVEDVAANRELVKAVLAPFDIELDTAEDGVAAIEAVRAFAYDLVLMDVQMPVMDGLTATRLIRALPGPASATPIVAMTANVLPDQVARCLEAGMDGHLGKPMNPAELLATIAYWTAEGREAPAEVAVGWPKAPVNKQG